MTFLWISQQWLDFDTQSVPGAVETTYRHSKSSRIVLSGSWTQIGPQKSTKEMKSILYEQLRNNHQIAQSHLGEFFELDKKELYNMYSRRFEITTQSLNHDNL